MIFGLFKRKQVVLTSKRYPHLSEAKQKPVKKKISRKKPLKAKKQKARKKSLAKKIPKTAKAKKTKGRRFKMEEKSKVKEIRIGEITHFFPHVNAAVIKLKSALTEGETVHIKGHSTDFKEQVTSMQINNKPIQEAKKGQEVGLLVKEKVRKGDMVFKEKS